MEVALIGDGVHDLLINLVATFPNWTSFTINALAMRAVVVTGGHGSSGEFIDMGANWIGTPDLQRYEALIASKEMWVKGKMTIRSVRI